MPTRSLFGLALLVHTFSAGALLATGGGAARLPRDLVVAGLTADQRLIGFETSSPAAAVSFGAITGLSVDSRIVGIDYRPADNQLYALGDQGGIYTVDVQDAEATFRSRLNVTLEGTVFGVDFNPTVDRLRVVSDNGQNLRINVDTGATTTDTALSYVGPPAVTALGVVGAAYTNNDSDPNTATTLYDIDSNLDQVVIQAPPNAGPLSATGKLTVDTSSAVGFDIFSALKGGTAVATQAFASLTVDGRARLYEIDLVTGAASRRGSFRTRDQVIDIAIPHNQR
jgi:hypothetical protein